MLFRLTDVRKSYGSVDVLRGVSFQINPGEKVGLVGRNGAGKTTVFRLVTGTESPDSGEVVSINGLKLGLLGQHVDFESGDTVHTAALSAFQEVHDIEAEMRILEKRMETDHSERTLHRYADLQTAFEQADGFTYAARAESILLGLGFGKETWETDTGILSGGQKNRLGMARLLLSSADVLLLDEPTNHLDVNAVEWLEEFLSAYDKAYVVISHDRYFLDRTTDRIIEIENGRAVNYKGNYSRYVVERELRRDQQQREFENQQAFINKTQAFIRKNLEGQKTKQAKSRRNMLERLERLDAVVAEKAGGSFSLKQVQRTGNNVLTTDDLAIGYGESTLAKGIGISLHRGEVLGVVGANGTGKTTFLKTILGELGEVSGTVTWGTKTNFGYYSQNLESLETRNDVIGELRRVAPLADSGELRSFLARFLFFGDDVFKSVGDLSGGEKGRLALSKLIYSRKNVLVLDEPTNHLDIPAREALEEALEQYDGTIVTVSHDRYFLDKIATQILSFEENGRVETFNGNYTEFHDWKAVRKEEPSSSTPDFETPGGSKQEFGAYVQKAKASLSKNQRERIEKRIAKLEAEIANEEEAVSKSTAELSDSSNAADPAKATQIGQAIEDGGNRIRGLTAEWEALSLQLETGEE